MFTFQMHWITLAVQKSHFARCWLIYANSGTLASTSEFLCLMSLIKSNLASERTEPLTEPWLNAFYFQVRCSRFFFYHWETSLSSVTNKHKEINENYTNNIALFINDYFEIFPWHESATNQIIFIDWFQKFESWNFKNLRIIFRPKV